MYKNAHIWIIHMASMWRTNPKSKNEWKNILVYSHIGKLYGHKNFCSTAMYNYVGESLKDKLNKKRLDIVIEYHLYKVQSTK